MYPPPFSPKLREELSQVAAQLQAGTLPGDRMTGRNGVDQLRHRLFTAQLSLRGWRSHPPRRRGWTGLPDCAGSLLLECRAIRHAFKLAGLPLTPFRPTDYNWR